MREPSLHFDYRLVTVDTVDSTNAEAKRLAAEGEEKSPDGTIIWAKEQTDGRGRRGRKWHSPPGNLYCSLILRPDVALAKAAELSFVAGLAVFDALGSVGEPGHQVHLKWPNDVLLNGGKVAGILLESIGDFLAIGIGVNLAHAPGADQVEAGALRPVSVVAETGKVVPPEVFLDALAAE